MTRRPRLPAGNNKGIISNSRNNGRLSNLGLETWNRFANRINIPIKRPSLTRM
jgi:hypothetical protein